MIDDRLGPILSVTSNKFVLCTFFYLLLAMHNLFGWSCKERPRLVCTCKRCSATKHKTSNAWGCPPLEYNPTAIKRPTNNSAIVLVKAVERNLSRLRSDREPNPVSLFFSFFLHLHPTSSSFYFSSSSDRPRPTPSWFHPLTYASTALSIPSLNKCN